jgi:hypothetical protein
LTAPGSTGSKGTFYRYTKRYQQTQNWGPPMRETIRKDEPPKGTKTPGV